jgi:hypothetical protein
MRLHDCCLLFSKQHFVNGLTAFVNLKFEFSKTKNLLEININDNIWGFPVGTKNEM